MSTNKMRLMQVLLAPQISEKATRLADLACKQIIFRVVNDATKQEIKAAVELLFKVQVSAVTVMNVKGKVKRAGRGMGRRSDWKKAIVQLQAGQDISFEGGNL